VKPWADEIRRHIETWAVWLGPLDWWPRYVYHFTDVHNAASIIQSGCLCSRAAAELKALGADKLDVLAWEFAMNMDLDIETLQRREGVDVKLIRIPREALQVKDPRKENIHFYEMPRLDVGVERRDGRITLRITDFNIYNLEDFSEDVIEVLQSYSDLIDYWAVDYDYDGQHFVSRWQTYRTRKDRGLELECAVDEAEVGEVVVVKVVDIFGNDTNKLMEVESK